MAIHTIERALRQLIRESISRPKIYVLVGPPGVGKSYWVDRNVDDPYIINRDQVVDMVRGPLGLKYDDMFGPRGREASKEADRIHRKNKAEAAASGKNIVVDMTNMGTSSRRNALQVIKGRLDDYEKIAVFFDYRGMEQQVRRSIDKRAEQLQDKRIRDDILQDMFKRFEMPTREEGFDDIIVVDPSETLNRP